VLNWKQLERVELFEKEREENMPSKFKKYNIIECIRSKYDL
jgi:hypothetical protein